LKKVASSKSLARQGASGPVPAPPGSRGQATAASDPAEAFWEGEYREQLTRRTLMLLQSEFPEQTWKMCWQVTVEGRSVAEVATEHQSDPGAVHAARFLIMTRLREELTGLLD